MVTGDQLQETILDAALERILQVGIRRASLDDIARRAGVNRVTIYRRFRVKENLVDAVLRREIERALAEAGRVVRAAPDVSTQIEDAVVYILVQTRSHPLVTQLLDVAPDEAVEFYTVRGEELVSLGIGYIETVLQRSQRRGAIGQYEVRPIAELLARFAHSLLLTPVAGTDFADQARTREFVRTTIVPMVRTGIPRGV